MFKTKEGEAVGALYNKEIGDIDLVWGDSKKGLQHIYEGRLEQWGNPQAVMNFIKKLPEIVEQSIIDKTQSTATRKVLINPKSTAIIELEYYGKEKKWLVSAYVDRRNASNPLVQQIDSVQNLKAGEPMSAVQAKPDEHIISPRVADSGDEAMPTSVSKPLTPETTSPHKKTAVPALQTSELHKDEMSLRSSTVKSDIIPQNQRSEAELIKELEILKDRKKIIKARALDEEIYLKEQELKRLRQSQKAKEEQTKNTLQSNLERFKQIQQQKRVEASPRANSNEITEIANNPYFDDYIKMLTKEDGTIKTLGERQQSHNWFDSFTPNSELKSIEDITLSGNTGKTVRTAGERGIDSELTADVGQIKRFQKGIPTKEDIEAIRQDLATYENHPDFKGYHKDVDKLEQTAFEQADEEAQRDLASELSEHLDKAQEVKLNKDGDLVVGGKVLFAHPAATGGAVGSSSGLMVDYDGDGKITTKDLMIGFLLGTGAGASARKFIKNPEVLERIGNQKNNANFIVKNENQKEKRGIWNVTFNGKNASEIRKRDLDTIIKYESGNKNYGAIHIQKHMPDGSIGQVSTEELLDIGNIIREGEISENTGKTIYELEKDNFRFRVIVGSDEKGGERVITFYSNRNTK